MSFVCLTRSAFLALTIAAIAVPCAIVLPAAAQQTSEQLDAEALAAVTAWFGSLVDGSSAAVDAVLAPEFQLMRADGSGYDKAGYLASQRPVFAAMPDFGALQVTEEGDLLVVRYDVTVHETLNGVPFEAHAPRLTVFRKQGDRWLVVAHANFAELQQ